MSESELYFLDDENQLREDERETLSRHGFSDELPKPFIVVPGDEEEFKENDLPQKTQTRFSSPDDRIRRPVETEPGVSDLTDHNYNNVVEHAYANTLFYRRSHP